MSETGTQGEVLPMYFVGDESWSMDGAPMAALNSALSHLRDGAAESPSIGEKVRFGVVTFAGDALCRLELGELSDEMAIPTLSCRDGGTSYASAFDDLRHRLPADIATLKGQGLKVRRPSVFFLSDGQPTDSPDSIWQDALAKLKDKSFRERPNILAFGIGDAVPDIIRQIATESRYAWTAGDPAMTAASISEFGKALLVSMSKSADALARGSDEIQVPEPEGFVSLKSDVL
jgi:uncharacterized protein YegL